jgi:argininosuccinate lyase
MLLRDGRLGKASRDVLEYTSSREADKRIFEADLLVDRAHLVMLREQGLLQSEICSKIIEALDQLKEPDLGPGEDVHEAIEAYIISKVGPEGGRMHTARSRNDEVATCIRLALREEMLALMDELLTLISTMDDLAETWEG